MSLLTTSRKDGVITVTVTAKLIDIMNVQKINSSLKDILTAAENQLPAIVLDLAAVETIDSSGISFLVRCHLDAVRSGNTFFLKNPGPKIMDVLNRSSLAKDFNIK